MVKEVSKEEIDNLMEKQSSVAQACISMGVCFRNYISFDLTAPGKYHIYVNVEDSDLFWKIAELYNVRVQKCTYSYQARVGNVIFFIDSDERMEAYRDEK